MNALRSRAGVVSITTGAAVLLALPVVAAGQVPGVDQVVGGVTETANSIAPAPPALPAPPAQVQAPAPAPKPAPAAQAPAPASAPAPAPAASAPAAPRQSTPAAAPAQRDSGAGTASARAARKARSAANDGGVKARSASDERASSSQDGTAFESGGADSWTQAVSQVEDASPETLPFTGLQLVLLAGAGLTALAGGLALRRGARTARR